VVDDIILAPDDSTGTPALDLFCSSAELL